jgi:hypothetical protein
MVKLAGPCFSLAASGSIADAITFSSWKGRQYARQLVIPENPNSVLQVSVRAMMKFLSQTWKTGVGATPKATWLTRAKLTNISPFNAFIAANAARWREFQAPSQTDPAPETGTLPVAVFTSATGGPSYADLLLTLTTINDCWGCMLFQSPTGTFTPSRANCIAVIPFTATTTYTVSGLAAGTYYFDAKFFTKEGVLGPDEGEMTCAVT